MYILSVAHAPNTEWSCVYNLEEFSVDVCMDGNYDSIYSFGGRDFE